MDGWEGAAPEPRRWRAVGGLLLAVLVIGFLLRVDGGGGGGEGGGTIDVAEVVPETPVRAGRPAPGAPEVLEPGGSDAQESGDPAEDGPDGDEAEDEGVQAADVVVEGEWRVWPSGPSARWGAAAAWTGEQLVVVGGTQDGPQRQTFLDEAHAYDLATAQWRRLEQPPLAARTGAGAVFDGARVLVWGGTGPGEHFADGALLEPGSGRWTAMALGPLSPRADPALHWTGREVLVVGGHDNGGPVMDAAAYDPAADRWREITAPPAGLWWEQEIGGDATTVVLWSPERAFAVYDLAGDTWTALTPPTPGSQLVGATSLDGVVHAAELTHASTSASLVVHRLEGGEWQRVGEPLHVPAVGVGRLMVDGDRLIQTFSEGGYAAAIIDTASGSWTTIRRGGGAVSGWGLETTWDGSNLVTWGAEATSGAFASSWSPTGP